MSQRGLIIGFANESRKRVLESYNHLSKENENGLIIQKANGFISNNKDGMQKEIVEIVKQFSTINTIYIVLTFDRMDMMKKRLSLIMNHFKYYVNNICLIVANFQKSQDKIRDQELIQRDLKDTFNLKHNFLYSFGSNYNQDSIYFNQLEIRGRDIINYFNQTICCSLTFDDTMMDLYPKINITLQNQIREYINRSGSRQRNIQNKQQEQNVQNVQNVQKQKDYKQERLYMKSNQQHHSQNEKRNMFQTILSQGTRLILTKTKKSSQLLKQQKYINLNFQFPWKKQSCQNITNLQAPQQAINKGSNQNINKQKKQKCWINTNIHVTIQKQDQLEIIGQQVKA